MIHRYVAVDSTQTVARTLFDEGRARYGDIVVAQTQTAGRGRRGRTWQSPPGGLYATWILWNDPMISVRAGTALVRAISGSGCAVGLKWPNDVLAGEKKIAGLLVEAVDGAAFIGVGVNVDSVPLAQATSMALEGATATIDTLIEAIGRELNAVRSDAEWLSAYREVLETLGRCVRIQQEGGRDVAGIALDVDALGHLMVDTGETVARIAAGACVHLGPADPASKRR